jgi:hypothetical protein
MTLDVALQKAKKDFRSVSSKEKNLPYYWAASILVGQTESMSVQKGFPRTWIITIALILLVGFAALKIGRQRTFKRSNPSWR